MALETAAVSIYRLIQMGTLAFGWWKEAKRCGGKWEVDNTWEFSLYPELLNCASISMDRGGI
jgi:hypothetical protein